MIMQPSVRIARHEAVQIRAHAELCEQVALALKVRRVAVTDDAGIVRLLGRSRKMAR